LFAQVVIVHMGLSPCLGGWSRRSLASQWRRWQESGTHATVEESAGAEKISDSYVGRVLRLTLLAPDIVEAILGGRQPAQMTLAVLMRRFPVLWSAQRSELLHPA
jgi:hypothetical protein